MDCIWYNQRHENSHSITLKPSRHTSSIACKTRNAVKRKCRRNKKSTGKNQYLLEQFRLAQYKQFGKSSEANLNQGELFNEAEQLIDEEIASEKSQDKETTRKTHNQPKRKPLPKDLPRETVVVDLPDEEKSCDCCGNDLHKMGEKKSERLKFIPAQIKVIETIRPQYSCRHCEKIDTKVQIKIAAVPLSAIPKVLLRHHY